MSVQVMITVPETALSILHTTPDAFVKELYLAAAVKWYEMGLISQSKAAEMVNLSREEFLAVLHRFGVSPFQTTPEELANVEN